MADRRLLSGFSTSVPAMVAAVFLSASVSADPPPKRLKENSATPRKTRPAHGRKPATRRAHEQKSVGRRAGPVKTSSSRARPTKSYLRTRRDYGHVRVLRPSRHDDGSLIVRPIIVRSARVTPTVLHRFEDHRRNQLQLIINHFHDGRREAALQLWGAFVDGLVDYHEPIDLDDIMLYIARESSIRQNDTFLFYAAKLEYLSESEEHLRSYIAELNERGAACARGIGACPSITLREIERERVRAQAELEVLSIELSVARNDLRNIAESSRVHESRFAAAYESLYGAVELRIRFSR